MRFVWALFDLDGTLADVGWRRHFIDGTDGKKQWDAFHDASINDQPRAGILLIAQALRDASIPIVVATGRTERNRSISLDWLNGYGIKPWALLMRANGDCREDVLVKADMLEEMRKMFGDDPVVVFDDRASVVRMWRAAGLTVCQVDEGEF